MKLRDLRHKVQMPTPKVNLHYTNLEERFEREQRRLAAEAKKKQEADQVLADEQAAKVRKIDRKRA